jgi:hypothetical protein
MRRQYHAVFDYQTPVSSYLYTTKRGVFYFFSIIFSSMKDIFYRNNNRINIKFYFQMSELSWTGILQKITLEEHTTKKDKIQAEVYSRLKL